MDAPDFDELEWMAQQEFDSDQPQSVFYAEGQEVVETQTEHCIQAVEVCHKRFRNDDCNVTGEGHKRGKMNGHAGEVDDSGCTVDCQASQSPDAWLPSPPPISPQSVAHSQKGLIVSETKRPKRRLADIEGDFIPITGNSGDRVYAEVQTTWTESCSRPEILSSSKSGLLSESFDVLVEKVEREALKKAYRLTEEQNVGAALMTSNEQLWVDKYAPKSFTELLSDEQTNREVLRWLKEWDTCVFGVKQTSTSGDVFTALRRHMAAHHHNKSSVEYSGAAVKSLNGNMLHSKNGSDRMREYSNQKSGGHDSRMHSDIKFEKLKGTERPEEKILLLCGPPGLGKTTLAHVAAKHCGYRVVEINASDDRVASTLQSKVMDAIQMQSVIGDMRPNCVVIDEIDGALSGADGKSAIDALLRMACSQRKETFGKENMNGVQAKVGPKRKEPVSRLSRPVICICNDLYAPALRQLRQTARVHVFAQPNTNRVVTRLKYICNMEGFKVNARALTILAEHTECDIRSCLNTLQFLKRKNEHLNMLDIASQVVGRKDMTSSAFDIWEKIFQKQKSVCHTFKSMDKDGVQEHKDFARLNELIANHGDFELICEGMHENLLQIRYQDTLEKTVECLELLEVSEIMSHRAVRSQQFVLNAYQPVLALSVRRLIAQPDKPFLEWPKTFHRFKREHDTKEELVRSWLMSMQPAIYWAITAGSLTQDFVSYLLHILSPRTLRPLAPQLLSQSEREEINQLVDTMIGYGINYKLTKAENFREGRTDSSADFQTFALEPPIHKLSFFKGLKWGHQLLSLTLRQILGHEVELETIRRENAARTARATAVASELEGLTLNEEALAKKDKGLSNFSCKKQSEIKQSKTCPPAAASADVPMLQALKMQKAASAGATHMSTNNFFSHFKRVTETAEKEAKSNDALAHRDSRPILFKFNEGFTNAIRRPMLVRDFL